MNGVETENDSISRGSHLGVYTFDDICVVGRIYRKCRFTGASSHTPGPNWGTFIPETHWAIAPNDKLIITSAATAWFWVLRCTSTIDQCVVIQQVMQHSTGLHGDRNYTPYPPVPAKSFPSLLVQQLTEYGLSCIIRSRKIYHKLRLYCQLTDNTICSRYIIRANVLQLFEDKFLLLQCAL